MLQANRHEVILCLNWVALSPHNKTQREFLYFVTEISEKALLDNKHISLRKITPRFFFV